MSRTEANAFDDRLFADNGEDDGLVSVVKVYLIACGKLY